MPLTVVCSSLQSPSHISCGGSRRNAHACGRGTPASLTSTSRWPTPSGNLKTLDVIRQRKTPLTHVTLHYASRNTQQQLDTKNRAAADTLERLQRDHQTFLAQECAAARCAQSGI